MVIVATRHIFGGGVYSVAGAKVLRMVGARHQPPIAQIQVAPVPGGARVNGRMKKPIIPPYMPEKISDPYHPGGNSACYAIQTAHLMGCNPIVLMGFTLQNASGYFFGSTNPVSRTSTMYDQERALSWLAWYRAAHPGRAKLWPGWTGPIYDVLETIDEAELRPRHESDPHGRHAAASG